MEENRLGQRFFKWKTGAAVSESLSGLLINIALPSQKYVDFNLIYPYEECRIYILEKTYEVGGCEL